MTRLLFKFVAPCFGRYQPFLFTWVTPTFFCLAISLFADTASAGFELLQDIVQYETYEDFVNEEFYDPSIPDKIYPFGSSTGVALEGGKAYSDWHTVGQLIDIGRRESGVDKITLRFRHLEGSVIAKSWIWNPDGECWSQDAEHCYTSFRSGLFMYLDKLGSYTFEMLINDVVDHSYTKQFEVIGPEFTIVGSSSISGEPGSSVLLRTQLKDRDGEPIENEFVTYRIPEFNGQGYGLYPTADISGPGSYVLDVATDFSGVAEVYVEMGYPGPIIELSATTTTVPDTTLKFYLESQRVEIEDLNEEENLGSREDNDRDPCDRVGDPINVITGNLFQSEQDLRGQSASPLEFIRFYNSKALGSTSIGPSWRHTFHRSITFAKEGKGKNAVYYAHVKRHDGKGFTLADTGDGYKADADIDYKLVKHKGKWELTTPEDEIERYNNKGKLFEIVDIRGNVKTLDYHKGRLTSVTSNSGEKIVFRYNELGQLASVEYSAFSQDPVLGATRTWTYGYNEGRLATVTNPDGNSREYHYENAIFPNALTGITDERGNRYSSWEYDSLGNAIASDHGFGAMRVDIDYGINGERTVTDSLGNRTTYEAFSQLGQGKISGTSGPTCSTGNSAVASYDYDPNTNDVLSRTVDGTTTLWDDYDENGNPGFMIEAALTAEERRTDYIYDPRFQNKVTSITEPSVYSGGNRITTFEYDDFSNLVSRTVDGYTPSGSPVSRTTTYQYNGPYHQLSKIDGPRTDVTDTYTFEYYPDDPDLYQYQGMLMRVTGPEGLVLRDNLEYNAFRRLISETRPNNLTITYQWEPDTDRLASVTESDGSTNRTTSWTYLPTGEVASITPPDGTTLTFDYDEARRLERITDNDGNYVAYTLDAEGNIREEKTYSASGSVRRSISRTFDVYNRLDVISQANESIDYDFDADGTLAREVNGNSVETQYGYDELKRLTSTTLDATGTDPSTAYSHVGYARDTQDNLAGVTDPNNGQTTYQYDDLGNLVSRTSPDTGTTTYQYDNAGNRVQMVDAKGQAFTYSYDVLNRLTGVDGPGSEHDISYSYDTCTQGAGRLCSVSRGSNANSFDYNAFGDQLSNQQTVQSFTSSVSSMIGVTYDNAGRLQTINYPGNMSVTYSYDTVGNVSQVTLNRNGQATSLLSDMIYEPFGPLKSVSLGNGINRTLKHDKAYRLTAINDPVYDTGITYDANGNIVYQNKSNGNLDTGYDALDKLTSATSPSIDKTYSYDKNGNRTQLSDAGLITNYGYQSQSNRLTSIGVDGVVLDANGNTTSLRGMVLAYSPDNRLISVTNSSETTQYGYNGAGERVVKLDSINQETVYHYGLQGRLLAELNASGSVEKTYVYVGGQPIAFVDYTTNSSGDLYYVHNDHLGTPQALTDESGIVVWRANYQPFGFASIDDDTDLDGQEVTFNVRFPGQYFDWESGLHYNYFRDYDPNTGRYIESDSIGLLGGLNPFGYAIFNPLTNTDYFGLQPECVTPGCMDLPATTNCAFVIDCVKDLDEMSSELIEFPEEIPDSLADALKRAGRGMATDLAEDIIQNMVCGTMNSCQCEGTCPEEPGWPQDSRPEVHIRNEKGCED